MLTMLDLAKLNGNEEVIGLIEENLRFSPEVQTFLARTITGTEYRTGIRTKLPDAAFRHANQGVPVSKSEFRNDLIQTFILSSELQVDKAVADGHEDGPETLQMIEASGALRQAFRNLGSQVYYGTAQDGKGFPGLKAATPFGAVSVNGDRLTINATGAAATTASSVYAVKFGLQDVHMVLGRNTPLELPDDWRVQQVRDAENKAFTAYVNSLTSWVGMQIGNENCVRRIANLTAEAGKGLTDALLADLLETFPVGYMPDALYMSRRSRRQLQASRSVVLQGSGKSRPDQPALAPIPTEYDGIPIIATDSILNTDAIET